MTTKTAITTTFNYEDANCCPLAKDDDYYCWEEVPVRITKAGFIKYAEAARKAADYRGENIHVYAYAIELFKGIVCASSHSGVAARGRVYDADGAFMGGFRAERFTEEEEEIAKSWLTEAA